MSRVTSPIGRADRRRRVTASATAAWSSRRRRLRRRRGRQRRRAPRPSAATAMSTRRESARAGSAPVNISPRRPPRSAGKKASALARAAVMAAAVVDPRRAVEPRPRSPRSPRRRRRGAWYRRPCSCRRLPAPSLRGRPKDRAVRFRARLRDGGDAPGDARAPPSPVRRDRVRPRGRRREQPPSPRASIPWTPRRQK